VISVEQPGLAARMTFTRHPLFVVDQPD